MVSAVPLTGPARPRRGLGGPAEAAASPRSTAAAPGRQAQKHVLQPMPPRLSGRRGGRSRSASQAVRAATVAGLASAATRYSPGPPRRPRRRSGRPARRCRGRAGRRSGSPGAAAFGHELRPGRPGDHLAVVDDHDAVGQPLGLLDLVGGEQHAHARRPQVPDHGPDGQAALRIDAGGRLVQEGHPRPADQGQGQGQPLLFAARQPPRRRGDRVRPTR